MVGVRNGALVALVAGLSVAVLAPPADARPAALMLEPASGSSALMLEPASGSSAPLISHPQDDWAGSQIQRYEGGSAPQNLPITGWPDMPGPGEAPNAADPASPPAAPPSSPPPSGLDVSSYQGNVNWPAVAGGAATFAYVKATESANYANPYFGQQYNGAFNTGLTRGAYHFATPNTSDGATQANYFLGHGGGWTNDGRTLPPALDLEYNPYGQTCYNMGPDALAWWVHAFVNRVRARTGRWPVIYTSANWWAKCMGGHADFGADPLWIARYSRSAGSLPPGWSRWAIWQFADAGKFPGDQDTFNGSLAQLRALATG